MHIRFFLISVMIMILIGTSFNGSASSMECREWTARVVSAEGRVESLKAGEAVWKEVKINDTYCPEDMIRTLEKSRAAILLSNETLLRLAQKTIIKFSEPRRPSLLEIITGHILFITRTPRPFTIDTPFVNAASEGTEFVIEVNEEKKSTTVTVIEGKIAVKNEAGSAMILSGQAMTATAGGPPVSQIVVRPLDSIQWALYYPPVLSFRELRLEELEPAGEAEWPSMMSRSVGFYAEGNMEEAFAAIKDVPEGIREPRFYVYRASLLLLVGRLDEAGQDIRRALDITPDFSQAMALQSVMAIARNEKESGLRLAQEAARTGPDSVSARVALSYAWQASFNIPEALAASREAVRLDPQSSLAWARLAELLMAEAETDQALDAARKSAEINPRESRAQIVLGFAYLIQTRIQEAKTAFEKAITLNSADPLARVGLGLARIREGMLKEGREEIEIAAGLDPNNSLIRSYLGKAYYEEKRDDIAGIQLDMAKELDPKDPTPYLYDAIRKQTENRPVEALHDLRKSIELNDNRAVYRSRFLLDNDQAARSVSLGRIYGDLGFEQAGLVEGWKSVTTDPVNYSAHRFLADSYSALPRSEIARLSEILVSQLLQPLNNNPVQPWLSDSSPAILAGSGPLTPSFNEFSQLFIRDRVQLLLGGVAGEQKTLGEEVIVTGLHGRYSYSLGQFHHETDGFRKNNDISQDLYNVFMQAGLTHKLSIQGEVRVHDTESGDIGLRSDSENFSPALDLKIKKTIYRLGLHYAPRPGSDIIVSALHQDYNEDQFEPLPSSIYTMKGQLKGHILEAQYLFQLRQVSFITGGGRFDGKEDIDLSLVFPPPDDIFNFSDQSKDTFHHTNFYLYSFIHPASNVTLTIGASADLYKGIIGDVDQVNPKFGLIWNPAPSTTLRAAAFGVLKKTLISSQTIEPTQIAGFQQFFDDGDGTDSRQYGIGIDQQFSPDLSGGAEFTYRDLKTPVLVFYPEEGTIEEKGDYRTGRAYLNWVPSTWFVTSAEYHIERLDQTGLDFHKFNTDRIPLSVRLFHPFGFFAKLKSTYINQTGEFLNALSGNYEPGEDRFWVWDASIGYRLPGRTGILAIDAKNIFDRRFRFQEIDSMNPLIQPERLIILKLTVSI